MTTTVDCKYLESKYLNKLLFFNYDDKCLRVYGSAYEPWFCAEDLAQILEYKNTRQAILDIVDTCDCCLLDDNGVYNNSSIKLINESGLYSFIIKSKQPKADHFSLIVKSQILPSIRLKDGYNINNSENIESTSLNNYTTLINIFEKLQMDNKDRLLLLDYAKNKFLFKNGNNNLFSKYTD